MISLWVNILQEALKDGAGQGNTNQKTNSA